MAIEKVVRKVKMDEQGNDFAYWQAQPYQARLAALEEIRQEYHLSKYGTRHIPMQKVYRIVKIADYYQD